MGSRLITISGISDTGVDRLMLAGLVEKELDKIKSY
jgi:hypothetical protein